MEVDILTIDAEDHIQKKEIRQQGKPERINNDTLNLNQSEVNILTIDEENHIPLKEIQRQKKTDQIEKIRENLKRKRRAISEKGRRHISRLLNLIEGKKALPKFKGRVNNENINIRFDTKGEFNIITKPAVEKIESSNQKLERLRESDNIPAYLKREKKIKFRATKVVLNIFDGEISVEAMILDARETCLMIGRKITKEIGRRLRKNEDHRLIKWETYLNEETKTKLAEEEARRAQVSSAGTVREIHKKAESSEKSEKVRGVKSVVKENDTRVKAKCVARKSTKNAISLKKYAKHTASVLNESVERDDKNRHFRD